MPNNWIQTATGRHYDLVEPRSDLVDIKDIAVALSRMARFNGHTTRFYSIAEHSVYVSMLCDYDDQLKGLLHDAAEAYLGDMVKPLKDMVPKFSELEDLHLQTVFDRYALGSGLPDSVKLADTIMLCIEARELMDASPRDWAVLNSQKDLVSRLDKIDPDADVAKVVRNMRSMDYLVPHKACQLFMERWRELNARE